MRTTGSTLCKSFCALWRQNARSRNTRVSQAQGPAWCSGLRPPACCSRRRPRRHCCLQRCSACPTPLLTPRFRCRRCHPGSAGFHVARVDIIKDVHYSTGSHWSNTFVALEGRVGTVIELYATLLKWSERRPPEYSSRSGGTVSAASLSLTSLHEMKDTDVRRTRLVV